MSTAGAFYAHAQSSLFGHTTRPSHDDASGALHRRTSSSGFGTGGSAADGQFLKSDSGFFAGAQTSSDINGVDPTSVSSKWPLETVMRLRRLFELWGSVEVPTPQCLFHLLAVAGALPPQWTTIDGERQGQYFTDAFFDSDDAASACGAGASDPSANVSRSSGGFAGIAGSKPSPSGNVERGGGSSGKSAAVKVKKINSIPEALNRVRAINVVLIAEELFDAFPADAFWLQFPDLLPNHLSTAADPSGDSQPSSQNAAEQALPAAATIPSGGKGKSNPAGSRNIGGKGTQQGDRNVGGKGKSAPVDSFDRSASPARAAPIAKSTVHPTGNAAALFLLWAQRCGAAEGPLLFSAATKVVTLTECVSVSALAFAIGARYTESQNQPQQSTQLAKSQKTGTPTLGFVGASAPSSTLSTFFDSHKIDRTTFRMKAARALLMPPPSSPTTMTAPQNINVGSDVVATSAAGLVTVKRTELSLGTTRRLAASLAVVAAKSRFHRSPMLHESNCEEPTLDSFGVRGDDIRTSSSSTGRDGGHEEDATGTDIVGPPPEFMVPWYGVTDVPVEVFCAASDGGEMDFFPATVKRVVVSVCDPTALHHASASGSSSPFSSAFEGGLPPISFDAKQASTALGVQNDNSGGVKTTRRMELRTRAGAESGGKASTDDGAKPPAGVCLCWAERTQGSGNASSTAPRSRSTAAPARATTSSGFSTARALRPLPPVVLEIAFAPTVRTLVAETCLPTLSSFTIAPEPSHSETPNPTKDDDESARGGVRTRRAHAAAQAEEVQKITQAVAAKRAQQTTVVKHFAFYSGLASGAPPMRQPVAVRMSAGTRDSRDVAASDFGQGVVRVLTTAAKRVLAWSSTFATAKSSAPKLATSGSSSRAGDQKSATEEEAEVVAATATAQTAAGALATWAAALSQFLPPPPSGRAGGANSGGGRAFHLTTTTHTQHHAEATTTPSRKAEDGKRTRSGQRLGRPPASGVTSATPSAGAHAAGGQEPSGSHPIPHGTVKFGIAAEATALAVHCAAQSAILASKCGIGATTTSAADQQGKSQQPRPARKGSKQTASSATENESAVDPPFIPDEHSIYARMSAVDFATRAEATAGYALALQPHTVGSSVFAGWAVVLATSFDRKGNRAFTSSTSSPTGDQGRYADSGSVSGGSGGSGGGAGAMSFEPIQALLQHQRIPAQLPPIVWRFTDALRAEMLLGTSSKSGESTGGAGSDAAAKSSRAPQPNPAREKSSQGGKKAAAITATNEEADETDRQRSAGVAKASGRRRGRAKASFDADENDAVGAGDAQEEKEKKKTRGRPPASSGDATPSRPTRALTLGASSEKKADSDSAAGTPTLPDKKATKGKSTPSSAPATGGDSAKRSASLESARLNSRGVTPSPAPDQEPRRGAGRMSLDERRRLAQEDAMRTEEEDMSSRFATLRKRNRDLSSNDDRGAGGLGDRPSRQSSTSRLDRDLEPRRSPAPQGHTARDSSTGTTPRRGFFKEELKDEKGIDSKSIEPHRSVRGSVGASAAPTSMPAPAPAMTSSLFRHAPKPKVGPMVAPVVPAKKIPVRRFDDANALGLWVAGESFAAVK